MKNLILYTTRYGCAEETANRMRKLLGGNCTLVNLMKERAPELTGYDTVILGGSVYIGRVQKQLTEYIRANLQQLITKNTGLYLCAGRPNENERRKELEAAFPKELLSMAAVKEVLGYAYQFEKMNFWDRFILKKVKGDSVDETDYADCRIEQFIRTLITPRPFPPAD